MALASAVPVATPGTTTRVVPAGSGEAWVNAAVTHVSQDFFETLGIRPVRGRSFTVTDISGATRVAVVSRRLADRLWAQGDPIGKFVQTDSFSDSLLVIGVAANTATSERDGRPASVLYLPLEQHSVGKLSLVVRTASEHFVSLRALQGSLGAHSDIIVYDLRTLAESVGVRLAPIRFVAWLLAGLAAVGIALALLGVYSVMSFFVTQRTREFGVYTALGARPVDIRMMILRQGLRMVLIGLVVGLPFALALGGILRRFLQDVRPDDPTTLSGVSIAVIVAGLVACDLPAARAARQSPTDALRRLG